MLQFTCALGIKKVDVPKIKFWRKFGISFQKKTSKYILWEMTYFEENPLHIYYNFKKCYVHVRITCGGVLPPYYMTLGVTNDVRFG